MDGDQPTCKSIVLIFGRWCSSWKKYRATNTCSYPQCGNTDATAKNSNSCKCGGTHCSASDYSDNGFYCNKASNICGVSTDILKYARTVAEVVEEEDEDEVEDVVEDEDDDDEMESLEEVVSFLLGDFFNNSDLACKSANCPRNVSNDKKTVPAVDVLRGGKYFKRRSEYRKWSTVVSISITPLSFKPVSLSLSRSPLSQTPKQVYIDCSAWC